MSRRFDLHDEWNRDAACLEEDWCKEYDRQMIADQQRQIESINQMFFFHINRQKVPHPLLLEARQIAPNQLFLHYDRRTDLASATNVSNY
ncbi:hypothetical protein [Tumebacillus algifaecis]|uniref:hypothetical protein n=1 Tax=Tumebacillus algifaecis TaxID=1214604 RepID=UPI001D1320A2|nr:hypothetical protein [Tumebacillus algifaecis]